MHTQKIVKEEAAKPKTAIEKPRPALNDNYWEELITKLPQRPDFPLKFELTTFSKSSILKELEKTIHETVDIATELASVGGRVHQQSMSKSRAKVVASKKIEDQEVSVVEGNSTSVVPTNPITADEELEDFWSSAEVAVEIPAISNIEYQQEPETILAQVDLTADTHNHSPASREIDIWLENLQKNRQLLSRKAPNPALEKGKRLSAAKMNKAFFKGGTKWSSWVRFNRKAMVYIVSIALPGLLIFGLVRHQGIWARNNIVQNGSNAVANLEEAKIDLTNFNFTKAADSFALAYDDLNKASGTLNQLGASFISVFGSLPGLSKVKAANNLVEAGQSLSKAGENLSLAFGTLYKTNLLSFLSNSSDSQPLSLAKLLTEFKDILIFANNNVKRADNLLADIDASAIPADKQELFINFKDKIPEFKKYIGEAVDYSDFLLNFVGANGTKTYLILLQNNSELRPTGGFPGSYGLITFENGALKKIFIEDIYRADARLKENIIPPVPLQHITPGWGMRDAAWFADFPTSARKVMDFYKLDGGPEVDGVLTITPDIIAKILDVIGPIEMPEYNLTLNSDNFYAAIQNEVEYKADRSTPKQILSDLQPKFFKRLAQQDKDHWVKIFKIISDAATQKHILAYFKNDDLENVAVKNGLGGEIKQSPNDYLQVVFANVKGSKTDFVTENSMNLQSELNAEGNIDHTLTINRTHNGGGSKYGFYNRDNSAYIKVYAPLGATLNSINGQSLPDFRPLIGYVDFGFKKDPDLAKIEDGTTRPFAGVDVFEESGKTVFGFWLITKPKESKMVTIKYTLPAGNADGYHLLWQKQSGTNTDHVDFSFKVSDGKQATSQNPDMHLIGDSLVLNSDLSVDRNIDIEFK